MGFASIFGRAKVNPQAPRGAGYCDRCGFVYNLQDLAWEMEWRGNDLMRTGFRVCTRTCLDVPFEHYRPLYLPPDPPPLEQPRPGNMAIQEAGPESWDGSNEYWDSGLEWDQTGNSNTDVDYEP